MNYQKFIITDPSATLRAIARESLRDRIGGAFLIGVVYLVALNTPAEIITYMTGLVNVDSSAGILMRYVTGEISPEVYAQLTQLPLILLGLYQLLVTGALSLGIATCYLRFRRRQECGVDVVFFGFNNFGRAFALFLLQSLFIFLWTLLFIIPGIIAIYRYKFAFMILADNPKMGPLEAIRVSKFLTQGNKSKLFCLNLSFIGWHILTYLAAAMVSTPVLTVLSHMGTSSGVSLSIIAGVITGIISALATGLLTVYVGTAEATLYERVCGLLHLPGDNLAPDVDPGSRPG